MLERGRLEEVVAGKWGWDGVGWGRVSASERISTARRSSALGRDAVPDFKDEGLRSGDALSPGPQMKRK